MSVIAVSLSPTHTFSKPAVSSITLVTGHGVQGDCHYGTTVQHRSRLHIRPPPPNLRQVHLLHSEAFDDVQARGSTGNDRLRPGDLGENVTTRGLDLLSLGEGTRLHFVMPKDEANNDDHEGYVHGNNSYRLWEGGGASSHGTNTTHAVVAVRGLRNPCPQIDSFRAGLKEEFVRRDAQGSIRARLAGVMGTVEVGGKVRPGMAILVEQPEVYKALGCV